MMNNPPTPTRPERAFVTAATQLNSVTQSTHTFNGECNAGTTFQTALNPTKPARPSVVNRFMKAGAVNLPRVNAVPIPAVVRVTSRTVFCHGVTSTLGASIFDGCV